MNFRASEEYHALSGCDAAVPTKTVGGSGTACLDWHEAYFTSETNDQCKHRRSRVVSHFDCHIGRFGLGGV